MCGIVFSLWDSTVSQPTIIDELEAINAQRGPDRQGYVELDITGVNCVIFRIRIYASVLHLRGNNPVSQPHGCGKDNDDLFCWNGEVFGGLSVSPSENDGALLYESIKRVGLEETFQNIEGPYAFIYYERSTASLFYGRDVLGRRSLLVQLPNTHHPSLVISSTSTGARFCEGVEEVSPGIIHTLRLSLLDGQLSNVGETCVTLHQSQPIPTLNKDLPDALTDYAPDWDCPPPLFEEVIQSCLEELKEAVRQRVQYIPRLQDTGSDADIAILFSGGLDCSIIAFLADQHLDTGIPIDLLNVAFENPRILQSKSNDPSALSKKYDVPDRISAREEIQELRRLSPNREWRLVEVDVPYEECQKMCPHIDALMHPSNTVMDRSLALALWFASRGIGFLRDGDQTIRYTSLARVLLSGLGADELFGGYLRHRKAFINSGWQGLIDELQLDLTRLPSRNMGRDDRVISDNGKECRYPFLALGVVRAAARIPTHLKLNPTTEEGTGDKQLLRMIAHRLDLVLASHRRKR